MTHVLLGHEKEVLMPNLMALATTYPDSLRVIIIAVK
jgi:hypothetical protein